MRFAVFLAGSSVPAVYDKLEAMDIDISLLCGLGLDFGWFSFSSIKQDITLTWQVRLQLYDMCGQPVPEKAYQRP